MGVPRTVVCLLAFCHIFVSAQDPMAEMTLSSKPPYYVNQEITVTCSGSDLQSPIAIILEIADPNDLTNFVLKKGCSFDTSLQRWSGSSFDSDLNNLFESLNCDSIGSPDMETSPTMTVKGPAQKIMENKIMQCAFGYDGFKSIKSDSELVSAIYVGPTNLSMEISNKSPLVGDVIDVRCTSDADTDPPSSYNYMLVRADKSEVSLSMATPDAITYTVTSDDVLGFTFKCTDSVHTTWTGGYTTMSSEMIYPIYLAAEGGVDNFNTSRNPALSNSLICNVNARPGDEKDIKYAWFKGDNLIPDNVSRNLVLDGGIDGESETYSCQAKLESPGLDVTLRWIVLWDKSATTTPLVIPTSRGQTSDTVPVGAIAGGVVGGVAAIALVGIAVGVYRWKQKQSNQSGSSGNSHKMKNRAGGEDGKGGGDGYDSNSPKKYKTDEIIYADLDLSGEKRPNVTRRDNGVEYAQIDLNKTKAMRNRPA